MGRGPVVQHVGGQDVSWVFLFPFSRVRFLLFFLTGGWGPYYDRQGRSGAMETVIYKTAIYRRLLRQRRSRCHGPSGCM